ncbi:hypothetical protein DM02DRAFT_415067 [Periconia macrospinosa]|uniref:Uncharacterized protein n=1 Tax=Periconia macrospinosa TaxID=97972 RepID=A0A2V1DPA4_9PLEO|nr:hypothetical protein DM02DRAFT_415067 [Periconia macrospinosa]
MYARVGHTRASTVFFFFLRKTFGCKGFNLGTFRLCMYIHICIYVLRFPHYQYMYPFKPTNLPTYTLICYLFVYIHTIHIISRLIFFFFFSFSNITQHNQPFAASLPSVRPSVLSLPFHSFVIPLPTVNLYIYIYIY